MSRWLQVTAERHITLSTLEKGVWGGIIQDGKVYTRQISIQSWWDEKYFQQLQTDNI